MAAAPAPGPTSAGQMMQQVADPLDYSDKYNTPIPPEKQAAFNQWVAQKTKQTGKNPLNDRYDYDVQGDWLAGAATDERGHGSDLFKKPNHPTFSDKSKYNGVNGQFGGTWINPPAGGSFYQPSATNIAMHGVNNLKRYFQQVEPDTQLLAPPAPPAAIGNAAVMPQ
jgi:hypothetical protein